MIKFALIIGTFAFGLNTYASTKIEKEIKDCISTYDRPLKIDNPVGTRCKTSKGVVFVLEDGGWRDTGKDGRLWFWPTPLRHFGWNWHQAAAYCRDLKTNDYPERYDAFLPSMDIFQVAESHGFREILREVKNYEIWTGTPFDENITSVYYFDGEKGNFIARDPSFSMATLCVKFQ